MNKKYFLVLLPLLTITLTLSFYSCKKNSTNSETDNINCNDLSISNNSPSYPFDCSGMYTAEVSDIQYDQYARRISWDFDISCSTSNETLTGSFYNMTYNNLGQLQTYDATINGKSCSYP